MRPSATPNALSDNHLSRSAHGLLGKLLIVLCLWVWLLSLDSNQEPSG